MTILDAIVYFVTFLVSSVFFFTWVAGAFYLTTWPLTKLEEWDPPGILMAAGWGLYLGGMFGAFVSGVVISLSIASAILSVLA